jgi:SAM-dependent methyltransferase
MKTWAKQLIPERYRLLRYELSEWLRYYPELIFSIGSRLECLFCGWHFRRFRPAGFDYPVLTEKHVVGGSYHPDDVCPRCLSNSRERLAFLYLQAKTGLLTEPLTVLHIAPEPNIARVLGTRPNLKYITADLFEPKVMTHCDIMKLPFADNVFDAIICNHVLEHVSDDRQAMQELYRVLKPRGWALLQVPIALAIAESVEDASVMTDADRIRVYGQNDHVRLYARPDYVERLTRSGFSVNASNYPAELGKAAVMRNALVPEEDIFFCAKP